MMGVRDINQSLEQWQIGVKDLRRRRSSHYGSGAMTAYQSVLNFATPAGTPLE